MNHGRLRVLCIIVCGACEYTGHIDYVLRGPSKEGSDEPHLDFTEGNYIYFDQPAPVEAKP